MPEPGAYTTIVLAALISLLCLAVGMVISWLLRPMRPTPLKLEPYECGEPSVGSSQIHFRTRYYLIALVFVVFDVEAVFLFPWAVAFQDLGLVAFWEMAVFVGILLLAWAYAWRKGALQWH